MVWAHTGATCNDRGIAGSDGMYRTYWHRVCARAWHDALLSVELNSWQRVMTRVLVVLIAAGLIGYFGGAGEIRTKLLHSLAALGAFALVFIFMYAINVALVPARLNDEQTKKYKALEQ